jgi:sporulation integral membrane protein YtvI
MAWLVAALIQPLISWIGRKTGLPKKVVGVVCLCILLLLCFFCLFSLFRRLYYEICGLIGYLSTNGEGLMTKLSQSLNSFSARFLPETENAEFSVAVSNFFQESISYLTSALASAAGTFVSSLPQKVWAFFIFLMTTFYICTDFEGIGRNVYRILPNQVVRKWGNIREKMGKAVLRYVQAYLFLFGMTFLELLIAFSILHIRYALALSALVAALDILPAIGVGTVLIPWAIYCFLIGEPSRAVGLLIVFGFVALIRQVVEPHVIGSHLGLHPIVTLLSVYVGLRILGLAGLFLAPIITILGKEIGKMIWESLSEKAEPNSERFR